jgi:hypothetical protein
VSVELLFGDEAKLLVTQKETDVWSDLVGNKKPRKEVF